MVRLKFDKFIAEPDESGMHRKICLVRSACAALLILANLLVIAVAWSPALHEWLHGDAGNSHHECAATVYAAGQIDHPATPAIPVAPKEPFLGFAAAFPASGPALVALPGHSQERAPPLA